MTRILIAGASGLIGRQVMAKLAADGHELHVLLRRKLDDVPQTAFQHVGPSDDWPAMIADLSTDAAISCLGTTMRSAGSQEAFRAVDHDLVLSFATAACKAGAKRMIAVSSVGAMPASSSFYLRTKAHMEQGLKALKFERLDIIRPGLLTGGIRPDSRAGESIAIMLAPFTDFLMFGPLGKFRSTPSAKAARAIAALAACGGQGVFIHENEGINSLAS